MKKFDFEELNQGWKSAFNLPASLAGVESIFYIVTHKHTQEEAYQTLPQRDLSIDDKQ